MRRLTGRTEPILDPDLRIVDAHHHLFDKPSARYLFDDYLEDVRSGHEIVASVYVEAGAYHRRSGPEMLRPLGEIEFANGVGAMCDGGAADGRRLCAALVGYADLRSGAGVAELLDRALEAAPDRMRGVRQIAMDHASDEPFRFFMTGRPPQGIYRHPKFEAGLREVVSRGLVYEATGFHGQLSEIEGLADAFPDGTFVLNHMTVAMGLDMDAAERAVVFREWSEGLHRIAQRPNVLAKIGGLGQPQWGFGFEDGEPPSYLDLAAAWRPFVLTAIDAFGPDRCMMESNFPPDGRSSGFVPTWNALKYITADLAANERDQLFSGTALRTYRIDLAGP